MIEQLSTPLQLGRLIYDDWQSPSHIKLFNELALKLIFSDNISRCIINVAIRSGKSQFWSQIFPAWFLLNFPHKKVLLCSSTAERVVEFSTKVRSIIDAVGGLNGVSISKDCRAKDNFKIEGYGGGLYAVGGSSAIAGVGAHLLIVDDVTRSQQEANSPVQRDRLSLWLNAEFLSRAEPGAKVVVVESRRGLDDISARLLKLNDELSSASQWHQINLPAISADGKALWPERYSIDKLSEIRDTLIESGQESVWHSLYQQDPIEAGNCEWGDTLVNDGLLVDELPAKYELITMSLDLAISKSENADNTACIVMGWEADGRGTVIDGFVGKMDICVVEDSVAKLIDIHKPAGILVEKNNFQKMVLDNLILKCPTANLFGYTAKSEKHERIRLLLTPLLHRSQFHIKKCQMGRMILSEMQQFPHGAHDDSLDAISYAIGIYNMISGISEEILPNLTYL